MELQNMSAKQLDALEQMAIAAGVQDQSYVTVRHGRIDSYSGECVVTMEDGTRIKCVGHRSRGDAYSVSKNGYIEFIQLES